MRYRIHSAILLMAVLSLFGVGAAAQQAQIPSQGQTNQNQSAPVVRGTGKGMMGTQGAGRMMGTMNQMNAHHQQMSDLMNKLMQSMAAIQNEKDPAALKAKLAEHSALLKQMHDEMMQQGTRMQSMPGMMMQNCPMASGDAKPSPSPK